MVTELKGKLLDILGYTESIFPEIILATLILIIITTDLILTEKKKAVVAFLTMAGLAYLIFLDVNLINSGIDKPQRLFSDMLTYDKSSLLWRLIFDIAAFVIVILSYGHEPRGKSGEYYTLIIALLLGAHMLSMSTNLLMIYLSIEVLSITSYILTAFGFSKQTNEAALKYLLFGAVASGIMLYGMSLIYSITGALDITTSEFLDALMNNDSLPVMIAIILVTVGFLFKISAIPFHIWTPDVYTAAKTPLVAYFSVVPKLAGIAVFYRWVLVANLFGQGPFDWQTLLAILSIITILVGNLSAAWQKNAKRLLAYSAIAHSGFLMIGLASFSESGLQSLYFYAVVYMIMSIGAFSIVQYFERKENITEIVQYKGLVSKYPLLTILLVVVMISLTGLPPTAGFSAKLFLFSSLWESYLLSQNDWLFYLLIFGLINTVISLFYYLKIPYFMIFKAPVTQLTPTKKINTTENYLSFILVVALLILFFKPEWLMDIVNNVSFAF